MPILSHLRYKHNKLQETFVRRSDYLIGADAMIILVYQFFRRVDMSVSTIKYPVHLQRQLSQSSQLADGLDTNLKWKSFNTIY